MQITLSDLAILHHADCREALASMASDSLDSCVTDPPYALVSIVKRFGSPTAAPAKGNDAYMRASAGFMGKTWDTGETAMSTEFWAQVYRVLKPGAFVAAFGASRGYHRMACAIEDAGFEIRDSLMWVYGTGFPKSHAVDRGIDEQLFGEWLDAIPERRDAFMTEMRAARLIVSDDARRKATDEIDARWREHGGFTRRIVGQADRLSQPMNNHAYCGERMESTFAPITTAATPQAQEWEGWGTALKPAFEPIVLARKPLSEPTVAANVLRWRTGALNIDACRIATSDTYSYPNGRGGKAIHGGGQDVTATAESNPLGRWPANLILDGSDEVIAAFPNTTPSKRKSGEAERYRPNGKNDVYGTGMVAATHAGHDDQGNGSAARFFYSAKASKADRAGSKHPTVKPIALMAWLAKLITPSGGTILDPFAGSGTTGAAATQQGFRVILCERESEYVADIQARFSQRRQLDLSPLRVTAAELAAVSALQNKLRNIAFSR